MGQRVDIFIIGKDQSIKVAYSHWGANRVKQIISEYIKTDNFDIRPYPMADTFQEAAAIVNYNYSSVKWYDECEIRLEEDSKININETEWTFSKMSCFCPIYYELKARNLWIWKKPKTLACGIASDFDED